MKYLVHQTLQIEADSYHQAAKMAIEVQMNKRDYPHCNDFIVHHAEGDRMVGNTVSIPLTAIEQLWVAEPAAAEETATAVEE